MKLYHGTAERHLPLILKDGLKPRGKRKGNWKHTIDFNPDAVYLTNAYALYFAWTATFPKSDDRLMVLEIDTDRLDGRWLAPDEDWLEQVSRKQRGPGTAPVDKPMAYRTRWYRKRLLNYAAHWKDSLEGLGNATYHGVIPVSAITRIAFIDQKTNAEMIMAGSDPTISLMNYRFVGQKYRDNTKRLFGEVVEGEDVFAALRTPEQIAAFKAYEAELYSKVEIREMEGA